MDAPLRSNQPGGDQRDLADTATKFEDAHAGGDSGAAQKAIGEGIDNGGLQGEAAAFMIGVSHHIRSCRNCHRAII